MKIAVTYENGQVFGHFGHCRQFLVAEVENGQVIRSEVVPVELYPGVSGDALAAVQQLAAGNLAFDPDTTCNHHHEEGHTCGEHDCGEHTCGGQHPGELR